MTPGFDEPAPGEADFGDICVGADYSARQPKHADDVRALPSPKEVSAA